MNKNSFCRYLSTGLFSALLVTNTCIAELLDIRNPDQLETAEAYAAYAELLPESDTYSDTHNVFNHLSEDQQSLAFQYLSLSKAGAIKQDTGKPNVNSLLDEAFYAYSKDEQTPNKLVMLADAYGSPAFQNSASQTPQLMQNLAKALEFGAFVQSGFIQAVYEREVSTLFLEAFGYWVAPPVLRYKGKSFQADSLDAFYKCNASPLLLNAPTFLATESKNKQMTNLMSFLQGCKIEKSVENPDKNILQALLEARKPLSPGLQQHAKENGIKLVKDSDTDDYSSTVDGLLKVVKKARDLPGALYLAVFRGSAKYQFGVFGVYGQHLNFTYVVDDNEPTPILNFSIPLADLDDTIFVDGIDSIMNGNPANSDDLMDKVDSVWLMESR